MTFSSFLVSFFAAVLGSLGMGGGGILLIYLTVFQNQPQLSAQGINLLFFLPIAAISLFFHTKHKLVAWNVVFHAVLWGVLGVFLGSWIAGKLGSPLLSKGFAVFLLYIGIRELFRKPEPPSS